MAQLAGRGNIRKIAVVIEGKRARHAQNMVLHSVGGRLRLGTGTGDSDE